MRDTDDEKPVRARRVLAIGGVLAVVLGLGVHVVMLQCLHVPYPDHSVVPAAVKLINYGCSVLAALVFYRLAHARFDAMPAPLACLLMFALWAMLKESLFRAAVMNGVVTTAWLFSVVSALPRILSYLIAGSLVVLAGRLVKRARWLPAAALVLSVIMYFVVDPLLRTGFAPVLEAIAHLAHEEVYTMPYGWEVIVPAFLTYAEPVIAAFVMAAMVWEACPEPRYRVARFVVVVGLMKGALLPLVAFSPFLLLPLLPALASEVQFTLEIVVTAWITAMAWQRSSM